MPAHSALGIFNDALSIDQAERAAFLERACGGDPHLIAEIASLLAVHDASLGWPELEIAFPELEPRSSLGAFVIVREIGRGGMGIVYLAEDPRLRRRLAIKTLSTRLGEDANRLARLEREARVLASLDHPNIAILHSLEESEGICYLVLEFVEGRTLSEELRSGPLSISLTLHLCQQIAAALSSAHQRGVVHRDLKPANVMVTPDSRVKLVDFGLAKVWSDSDRAHAVGTPMTTSFGDPSERSSEGPPSVADHPRVEGTAAGSFTYGLAGGLVGTPGYMSPEQLRGLLVDRRADLWSFGCILYECLAGRPAFHGNSVSERISATMQGDPDWTYLPAETPESVAAILRACLCADPARRPASMHEVLPSLATGIESGPTSPNEAVGRSASKTRAILMNYRSLLLGVGALMATIAGLVAFGTSRTDERPSPVFHQVSFEGNAVHFAVSPDGKRAAYSTRLQELVVRDFDAGTETRRRLPFVSNLDWSPSGSEILAVFPQYLGADMFQTVVVPTDGGDPWQLGPPGFHGMAWSPDGSKIAGLFGDVPGRKLLNILDVTTGEVTPRPTPEEMGRIESLQWSPAGALLLINTAQHTTWTLGIDGSAPRRVIADGFATWGPSGESILFLSKGGLSQLRVDPTSGRPIGTIQGICDIQQGTRAAMSRDGERLFVIRSSQHENLWQLDLTPEPARRSWARLTSDTRYRQYPRISPSGNQVACLETVMGGGYDLVLHDLVGGSKPVAVQRAVMGNPAWSPDGSEIAIQVRELDARRVVIVSALGHMPRQLEAVPGNDHMGWVPERGIVFQPVATLERNYQLVSTPSGETSMLFTDPEKGTAFQIRPSPDGTRIAIAGNRGSIRDLRPWIVHLADGSETLLLDQWASPVGWSRDSESVYVIATDPNDSEDWRRSIFRVRTAGGEAELVASLPGPISRWNDVDVSQDERTLVCAVLEGQDDLWLVDNLKIE